MYKKSKTEAKHILGYRLEHAIVFACKFLQPEKLKLGEEIQ